jgi:hypothetical protein
MFNLKLVVICALGVAASSLTFVASAGATLTADYRFENNFKSSGGGAPDLHEVESGGVFEDAMVGNSSNGVWTWQAGDGLRLNHATKVLGLNGRTYTFVLLVNLDEVDSYRKLVDFDNLNADEGWYEYSESLYPYDLSEFNRQEIQAGKWRQIALTRDEDGFVRGYVGDVRIGSARDRHRDIALGADKILHFLMDDSNVDESTGGQIARLRVWDGALSAAQVKDLGK